MNTPVSVGTHRAITNRTRLLVGAAALIAVLGVVFVRNFTDFAVYYAAGQSLLNGRIDLYSPDFARGPVMDYRYLPVFILVFAPLSLLPYTLAALFWHLLNTLAIVVAVLAVATLCHADGRRWVRVGIITFLIVVPYFAMALDYGNVQLIVTALLFAGASLAIRGRDLQAAPLLAAAIIVKIVPALVLPYFFLKRRGKLLGLVLVATVVLLLLPALRFGFAGNLDLVARWYHHVVGGQEFHEINGPINLSLKGQLQRMLTRVDYTRRIDGDHNYAAVNIASLPAAAVDGVWRAVSVCAFAGGLFLIMWSSRRPPAPTIAPSAADHTQIEALQVGLLICLMLFVGPLTSKAYLVALLWPVIVVGVTAWDHAPIRRILVATAILSSTLPLLPGRAIQRLLLVAGTDFYVSCVVLGLTTCALVLVHRENRDRTVATQVNT